MERVVKEVRQMNKGLVGLGLIGGIIALIGVFTSWVSMSASGMGVTVSADITGWEIAQGEATVMGTTVSIESQTYPYVALAGGILALIGAIGVLASPGTKGLVALLVLGGMLALVGAAWGLADIETGTQSMFGVTADVSYGYGIYLALVGGILGLIGAYGARK